MAITLETIEKVNIESVLRAAEQRVKAEAALSRAAKARGIDEKQLAKAIDDTARAEKETLAAAERAGKAWRATEDLKQKEINQTVDAELRAAAAAEKLAAAEAKRNAVAKQRADARAYLFNVRAASEEMDKATVSTGAMTAATGNLRSQLIDIGVGLQGGQNPFTIMSQQGPQIAEVFMNNTALAAKFAAVLPTIGIAAAGAAAVGAPLLGWYYELGVENEKLIELSGKTAKAMDRLAEGVDKIVEAQADLDVREGILSGAVSEKQAKEIKAQAEATEIYGDAIGGLKEKLGALQTELERVEGPQGILATLFGPGAVERANKAKALRAQIEGTKEDIKEFNDEQATFVKRTVEVGEAEDDAKDKGKGRTKAIKAEKDALRDLLSAQQDYLKSLQDIDDVYKPKKKDDRTIHEKFDAELRGTLKTINEKEKLAREAARKATQSEEELQEALTEIAIHAEKERAEAIAAIRAEEDAARRAEIDAMATAWADAVVKQGQAEAAAAAQSKQISAARRDALLSVTDSLAASAAEAFGAESKVAKAAAVVQLIIAEAEMLAKAATLGPIAGPIYAAAGTATIGLAAAKLATADTAIEAFNDTPSMQRRQMGPQGGLMRFAPGDIVDVAAARRPSDLAKQTGSTQPTNVSTTVKFTVNGRTAQSITTHAKRTRRGTDPGAPVAGHRRTRY